MGVFWGWVGVGGGEGVACSLKEGEEKIRDKLRWIQKVIKSL